MRVELLLPLPPSVNRLRRYAKHGSYPNPKVLAWVEEAHRAVVGALPEELSTDIVHVEVRLYGPTKARWDIDNRVKVLLDFLEGRYLADDTQCDKLTVRRGPVHKGGGCWVIIETMDPGALVCPAWPAS